MTAGTSLQTPLMDVARQTGNDVEVLEDADGAQGGCVLLRADPSRFGGAGHVIKGLFNSHQLQDLSSSMSLIGCLVLYQC